VRTADGACQRLFAPVLARRGVRPPGHPPAGRVREIAVSDLLVPGVRELYKQNGGKEKATID